MANTKNLSMHEPALARIKEVRAQAMHHARLARQLAAEQRDAERDLGDDEAHQRGRPWRPGRRAHPAVESGLDGDRDAGKQRKPHQYQRALVAQPVMGSRPERPRLHRQVVRRTRRSTVPEQPTRRRRTPPPLPLRHACGRATAARSPHREHSLTEILTPEPTSPSVGRRLRCYLLRLGDPRAESNRADDEQDAPGVGGPASHRPPRALCRRRRSRWRGWRRWRESTSRGSPFRGRTHRRSCR